MIFVQIIIIIIIKLSNCTGQNDIPSRLFSFPSYVSADKVVQTIDNLG